MLDPKRPIGTAGVALGAAVSGPLCFNACRRFLRERTFALRAYKDHMTGTAHRHQPELLRGLVASVARHDRAVGVRRDGPAEAEGPQTPGDGLHGRVVAARAVLVRTDRVDGPERYILV